MRKHLIVYGTQNYNNAIRSLIKSSKNFFDEHHVFGPSDISGDFYEKNQHILDQKRGAGYWLWKPYFIYKTLKKINDGEDYDFIIKLKSLTNNWVVTPEIYYNINH